MSRIGALLAITGVLTGLQTYRQIMWAVWGAPTHPIQYFALVGAALLIGSGIILLFDSRRAIWLAVVGLGISWTYYGPAVFVTVLHGPDLLALIPPALLLYSTVVVVRQISAKKRPSSDANENRDLPPGYSRRDGDSPDRPDGPQIGPPLF